MALWEVSLRTQYDYPFIEMSGRHPGVPISMWCIWNRELVQIPNQDEGVLRSLEKEIRKTGRVIDKWVEAGDTRVLMLRCTCGDHDSPWNVWEAHDFKEAPPAVYRDGWGYFRLLTFDETATKDLFRDFSKRGPAELLGKKELTLNVLPTSMWVNSLFGELTGKQMDAILKAHRYGYYVSPRKVTTESVAASLGVSRSTYEEHLRKAENRIIEALIPYMQLFAAGEKNPAQLPTKGSVLESLVP